ncbi:heme biosynthesis HemY N-terminal domain-containing protein [Suttonella ornithocola]|uniref:Putative protoheme IX biogenesis protein n=1 Tax=Suttonella ornithocola TaxID=279832 RepID=A0A380MVE3_9GAMM|nr:heme biosynthesis HemY N-terminal domain-containing protein [Suttonella ornithocola]SUO96549.1 putative protoheme IX biogenesis protein [Suttonella ornithocola]
MIRTLIVLIILSLCVIVGYNIQTLPAYVRIYNNLNNSFIETPFISWIIFSLIGAYIILIVLKILWLIWRSPKLFSRNAARRKEYKAHRLLEQGLSALTAGDYHKAEKKLAKGGHLADELGQPSVIYFENAAIAADKQNANQRRDEYFLLGRKHAEKKEQKLTSLTEAEILVNNHDYVPAIKILEELRHKEPRNLKILELLDTCYYKTQHWESAWQNLTKLRHNLSPDEFEKRQKKYARGMLKDTSAIETYEQLQTAWKQLPADIRGEKEMLLQYISSLVENGHGEEAEKILIQQIKSQSDIDLIQAYSQLRGINFSKALNNIQHWESQYPGNATFLYCKALIAYRAKEYDIAAHAIEASLKLQSSTEGFALWGAILEAKQQPEAALVAYRQSVAGQIDNNGLTGELLLPPAHSA